MEEQKGGQRLLRASGQHSSGPRSEPGSIHTCVWGREQGERVEIGQAGCQVVRPEGSKWGGCGRLYDDASEGPCVLVEERHGRGSVLGCHESAAVGYGGDEQAEGAEFGKVREGVEEGAGFDVDLDRAVER